jgi:hypothetical protein
MGTWGSGNFDQDASRDLLADLIEDLSEKARSIVADKMRLAPDEDGVSALVPLIAIIHVLSKELRSASVPSANEVATWKGHYLSAFDEQMPSMADEAFYKERRAVVEKTFDDLIALSREWERFSS